MQMHIDELHLLPFAGFRFGDDYMHTVLMTAKECARYKKYIEQMVVVSDVIVNGPATVVKFSDGTKVVSKAHMGDKPSVAFGLVWCCLRKAMRNRTCDHMEKVVRKIVRKCTVSDMRALGKALVMAAERMEGQE